jgi:uncharacterized protein YcfJ
MRKALLAVSCFAALIAGTAGANAQDALGGAIVGGATGAAVGGAVGGGRGAAVGAAVGATTGAAVGANAEVGYYHHHHRHCWVNQWGHEHCRYY